MQVDSRTYRIMLCAVTRGAYMKQYTQSLIDNGQIKQIELGTPDHIIKLINIQNIY